MDESDSKFAKYEAKIQSVERMHAVKTLSTNFMYHATSCWKKVEMTKYNN